MYVLMGANGNITSKAAAILLGQGAQVRVIGRRPENLAPLQAAGAAIAVGDATDAQFLTEAFTGADAVYVMIPPNYASAQPGAEQDRIGEAISKALAASGVARAVNLSSGGAHLPAGTGPIAGLHRQEQRLNRLQDIDILHLRPGYFFENHLTAVGTIKALGVYPGMERSDVPVAMIATQDIAAVVARELQAPAQAGRKRILHLQAPRQYTMQESASILGAAIGRPDLKHVQADPAQAKAGLVQHGISPAGADLFGEMARALSDGSIAEGFATGPTEITRTTLEDFAPVFAKAYRSLPA